MTPPVIGIDLGTTYSCVGIIRNGNVEIVANDKSKRITPSVVVFTESEDQEKGYEVVVEDDPNDFQKIHQENVISCAKRLIGRKYDDQSVQKDLKLWPFNVVEVQGRPKYQVEVNGKPHTFFPEEVSAEVLKRMKKMAEKMLNDKVQNAVITVPAYFNENQKQATRDAAKIAGLFVIELLSEPTAAAIAYGADLQMKTKRNVLVFDFGGGTFDVSVIQIEDGVLSVLAVDGDPRLGGEDIDYKLALHFQKTFNDKHKTEINLKEVNPKAWRRLKHQCEQIKVLLSTERVANLRLASFHDGKDLSGSIARFRFEETNEDIFQTAMSITERAIVKSRLKKNDIHDVLLVGGTTRIPKVRQLLSQVLPNANFPSTLNADEAVAVGATIVAAAKVYTKLTRIHHIKIWNVLPQSLGIGTGRGHMHILIEGNTCVPVNQTMTFTTEKDNQHLIRFKVYEGEDTDTSNNYFLGEFRIAGIPPAPRGLPEIEVTFSVDQDCILKVTAEDLTTSRTKALTIQYNHDRLTEEELRELQERAQTHADHHKEVRVRLQALEELEKFVNSVRSSCLKESVRSQAPSSITKIVDDIYQWIDKWHRIREYPMVLMINEKKKELEDVWNPFMVNFNRVRPRSGAPVLL